MIENGVDINFESLKEEEKKSITVLNIRKYCVEIHLQLAHDLAN